MYWVYEPMYAQAQHTPHTDTLYNALNVRSIFYLFDEKLVCLT